MKEKVNVKLKKLPKFSAALSDVNICETAGFVDLETRFKRMEQSGYVAQFYSSQFDVNDMREIYLGDDTAIYADDDEETVARKLALQERKKIEIQKAILGDLVETNDETEASQGRGSSEDKSPSQKPVQKDNSSNVE